MDALATWRRWAEPACVDYGLHMTFTERVPERAIAGVRRSRRHVVQAVHGVPRAAAGRRRRDPRDRCGSHASTAGWSRCTARTAARSRRCAARRVADGPHRRARARARPARRRSRPRRSTAPAALAEIAGASVYVVHLSSAPGLGRGARRRASAASTSSRRRARSTSISTPRAWPAPTASRSCARRRCATRGTSRSCGTASRPARCTRSPPTTARSPWPTGAPACAPGAEGYADFTEIPGGLPGIETRMGLVWEGVARGPHHACRLGAARARRRRRARSGCGPRRATCASAPTPTSSCGTRTATQSLDAGACTWRSTTRPTRE